MQHKEEYNRKRRENYLNLSFQEKEIRRERSRQYGKANRERLNEWAKEYRRNNPEWAKEVSKKARTKLKEETPEKSIYLEVKKRAKQRAIDFNLDLEDIIIPKTCPILGIELRSGKGRALPSSPSLDRLDPTKGYTKGNCFIISHKANRMKQDNTLEDLERLIKYIKERL